MPAWLPAHEALLEMMIYHLPSPATAQVRFLEEREANEREREGAKAFDFLIIKKNLEKP